MKSHQTRINNSKQIFDYNEFIGYINLLSDSIQNFHEVSKNINANKKILINLIERDLNTSKSLLDKILKEINYNQINLINNCIEKIKDNFNKLKIQAISEEKNLFVFCKDAKILFNKLKEKSQKSVLAKKTNRELSINNKNSNKLNNSLNSFNNITCKNLIKKENYSPVDLNLKNRDIKFSTIDFINRTYSNINSQYFTKIDDEYSKKNQKKEYNLNNFEYTPISLINKNNIINQNKENKNIKIRKKLFSSGTILESISKNNAQILERDELMSFLKEGKKDIRQKSNELMKIINNCQTEIEKIKKENIKLNKNDLTIRKDLNNNFNNFTQANSNENEFLKKKINIIEKKLIFKQKRIDELNKDIILLNNIYQSDILQLSGKESDIQQILTKIENASLSSKNIIKNQILKNLNNPLNKKELNDLNSCCNLNVLGNENLNNKLVDSYKKENEKTKKENIYLKNKIEYYQIEIKEMKNKLFGKKQSNIELENNNQNIIKELEDNYEKKISEIYNKYKNIENMYKEINSSLKEQISSLNKQLIDKNGKLLELYLQIDNLDENVKNKQEDNMKLIQFSKKMNEEFNDLQKQFKDIQNKYFELKNRGKIDFISEKHNRTIEDKNKKNIKDKLSKELKEENNENEIIKKKNLQTIEEFEGEEINNYLNHISEEKNKSNYEEEFDLKRMAKVIDNKDRSQDIEIDYPGIAKFKEENRKLHFSYNSLLNLVKKILLTIQINPKNKTYAKELCNLVGFDLEITKKILSNKNI